MILHRWQPEHSLVLVATLLAAALRLWHLGTLPPAAWYDEIWFALRGRELLQTAQLVAHYGIEDTAGNAGLVYLTALVEALVWKSIIAARAVSALSGILTIPLAYACLREIFRADFNRHRRVMAALAALILAYLPAMVIAGRVGIEPAMAPPVALAAVWQVMLGMRRSDWRHWALAGLVAGLAQYNGPHARFVLPLIAYVIVELLVISRPPPLSKSAKGDYWTNFRSRPEWAGMAILIVVGTGVNIPLIATFIQHPGWFYGRAEAVSAGISLSQNIGAVLGSFQIAGDLNARQNIPGQPLLDLILGAGFLIGVLWAVFGIRRWRTSRLLLTWLILMALPSILTADAPNFGRMIGVAPPAAALAIIGWTKIFDWIAERLMPRLAHRALWAGTVAAGLAAISLGWSVYLVFSRWAASPDLADAFTTASVQAARTLVDRAKAGDAVFVERLPEVLDEPAFAYLFAGTPVARVDFRQCVPLVADPAQRVDYLFLPEDDGRGANLLKAYALLKWNKMAILWGRTANLAEAGDGATRLPAGAPAALFAPGIRLAARTLPAHNSIAAGSALHMTLYWHIENSIPSDLTAFVHVQGVDATDSAPVAQDDRQPCGQMYPASDWRQGEIIAYMVSLSMPHNLPPGEYLIAAGWYDSATGLRTPLISADDALPGDRAVIGRITVTAPSP